MGEFLWALESPSEFHEMEPSYRGLSPFTQLRGNYQRQGDIGLGHRTGGSSQREPHPHPTWITGTVLDSKGPAPSATVRARWLRCSNDLDQVSVHPAFLYIQKHRPGFSTIANARRTVDDAEATPSAPRCAGRDPPPRHPLRHQSRRWARPRRCRPGPRCPWPDGTWRSSYPSPP